MHAQDIDPAFGNWLAGFIDGEGCFHIGHTHNKPNRPVPRFALALRDDDRPILEEIAARVGGGYIMQHNPNDRYDRPGSKPKAILELSRRADCMRLVELLDRFPLRAKKARDYAIWREAVLLRAQVRVGGGNLPNDWIWDEIERLGRQLIDTRAYESPPPRPEPELPPRLWED